MKPVELDLAPESWEPELPTLRRELLEDAHVERLTDVLDAVSSEVLEQLDRWGIQNHPSYAQPPAFHDQQSHLAKACADTLKQSEEEGWPTPWSLILLGEVHAAMAETDPGYLTQRLLAVAAVSTIWMERLQAVEDGT